MTAAQDVTTQLISAGIVSLGVKSKSKCGYRRFDLKYGSSPSTGSEGIAGEAAFVTWEGARY
jgi:hypothetical protein